MDAEFEQRLRMRFSQLAELMHSPVMPLGEIASASPRTARDLGVYAISLPGDPSTIVYVGRTKTKTVRGRIRDHLRIGTSSDLRGMLKGWPDLPQDAESYEARWVAEADDRERAFRECFAISMLMPRFNRP
ncbi:GIY-YIG nuclease family protein [bacterium]|nr:GIY-YIG nuclease family protein [bacterium]